MNIHVFAPLQPNMLEVTQVSTSRHLPLLLQSTTADTLQQQISPLDGSGTTNCWSFTLKLFFFLITLTLAPSRLIIKTRYFLNQS